MLGRVKLHGRTSKENPLTDIAWGILWTLFTFGVAWGTGKVLDALLAALQFVQALFQ